MIEPDLLKVQVREMIRMVSAASNASLITAFLEMRSVLSSRKLDLDGRASATFKENRSHLQLQIRWIVGLGSEAIKEQDACVTSFLQQSKSFISSSKKASDKRKPVSNVCSDTRAVSIACHDLARNPRIDRVKEVKESTLRALKSLAESLSTSFKVALKYKERKVPFEPPNVSQAFGYSLKLLLLSLCMPLESFQRAERAIGFAMPVIEKVQEVATELETSRLVILECFEREILSKCLADLSTLRLADHAPNRSKEGDAVRRKAQDVVLHLVVSFQRFLQQTLHCTGYIAPMSRRGSLADLMVIQMSKELCRVLSMAFSDSSVRVTPSACESSISYLRRKLEVVRMLCRILDSFSTLLQAKPLSNRMLVSGSGDFVPRVELEDDLEELIMSAKAKASKAFSLTGFEAIISRVDRASIEEMKEEAEFVITNSLDLASRQRGTWGD
ncbi:hypothetical protein IE53DRAFT_88119 [Violaceomyces palustris]|uniref:Uncharacterized protein n=1 Tax=Violaceomyces palustris TaxID=1673888 RepID=A0ACD0NXM4_9BASI|nr:hypothetical protein IE53DRAFT_88119 [Violaceomyces palustris]